MRNGFLCLLLLQAAINTTLAQGYKGQVDSALMPQLSYHYQQELTIDKPTYPAAWNSQQGPHISFGSSNELYFRSEVPAVKETDSWKGVGWRGERLNAQIVIWSADTLEQVRLELSDLQGANGTSIGKNNIRASLVRYVLGNYPYRSKDGSCGDSPFKDGFLLPDRFEPFDRFDLPGRTVRPVWVTIDIPAGAKVGHYKGGIKVLAKGVKRSLEVDLEVQDQLLPPPHEWRYRLDLWQNPWVLAWQNHLQPWSDEHKLLLKKHLNLKVYNIFLKKLI